MVKTIKIKNYIDNLLSKGRHFFSTKDLKEKLGISDSAMWSSLSRLKKKGEIVSPAKGYYVIVPLTYRSLGTLPPEQFIHHLMKYLQTPYYVGLLSAAQRYGAAHQQPQVFQVVIPKHHRLIKVGRIEVTFIINKYLHEIPTREFKTPRGTVLYSSPEATAIDLVVYSSRCGGLNNVLTILGELVEQMNIEAFKRILENARENPALQRLAYLFELLGENALANTIAEHLGSQYLATVPLDTRNPNHQGDVHTRWRLLMNTELESDL